MYPRKEGFACNKTRQQFEHLQQKGKRALLQAKTVQTFPEVCTVLFYHIYPQKGGWVQRFVGQLMENGKCVYKKLNLNIFAADDVIKDLAGNVFLKRTAVAKLFQCSLPTLATTYKRKGLLPLDRYVSGHKVYLLDDVEMVYNRRAAY